jgi:hypothetical protein
MIALYFASLAASLGAVAAMAHFTRAPSIACNSVGFAVLVLCVVAADSWGAA